MPAILDNLAELKKGFPHSPDAPASKHSSTKKHRDSTAEIRSRITLRIKKGLEFPHTKFTAKDDLVRVFTRDFESLDTHLAQWLGFVEELQRASFSFTGLELLNGAQLAEVNSDVQSLFEKSKTYKFNDDKTLVDEVFQLDFEEMRLAIGKQLDRSVGSFVTFLFKQFAALQANNILGTIRWGSTESCSFVDWQHDVRAERLEPKVIDTKVVQRNDGFAVDLVRESVVKTGIVLTHSATRREQHLMKTEESRLSEFQPKIPRCFDHLVSALPEILRPEIRVISGEAFRNEKTRHKFGEKNWTEQRVQTEVVERLRVYYDPAVIIGDTVLFAWDNDDSIADEKRHESLNKLIWACSCAVASVIVVLAMSNQNVISRLLFASPVLACGVWLAITAYQDRMVNLGKHAKEPDVVKAGLGWLCVTLGLCITAASLTTLNLAGIAVSVAAIVSGIYLIKQTLNSAHK